MMPVLPIVARFDRPALPMTAAETAVTGSAPKDPSIRDRCRCPTGTDGATLTAGLWLEEGPGINPIVG